MLTYQSIISQMTLEEKCSLLSGRDQFSTRPIPRLGVPSVCCSDGPHGVRKQEGPADHLGLHGSLPATCFPTSATMANSWDTALMEALGEMLGEEAAALGVSVLLGPGLNVKRSPLCGRNFEYFSEDPYLSGKLAAASIRGIQSKGVAACPKHFAVNSQETMRMHSDSVLDERTLRELYLTGFEIAVREGAPKTLMTSYNRINGVYANENRRLLEDVLRGEWGFDGAVITDWGGGNDRTEGLLAGNHLEMPGTGGNSDRELVDAVRDGRLPLDLLDRRVDEFLRVLFAVAPAGARRDFDREAHHAFARRAAEESIVLLKNEGGLLPLRPGAKVAVIGGFAETPRYQGAGSSLVHPTRLDRALDELRAAGVAVVGSTPGFRRAGREDEAGKQAAVALARRAEVVLLYMGLDEASETEGLDRTHLRLHDNQIEVLEAVAAVNPNVVAVLAGGAPFEVPWLDRCGAAVHGYLGGQAGAGAMARVLTGAVNPSGKLAETWPLRLEDTPNHRYFPGKERTAEYREGLYVGYRYYQTAHVPVRFPFGFGLSYTSFSYGELQANEKEISFTLKNTGDRPGAEVVQVYVSRPDGRIFRPEEELKGFAKVSLEPGASQRVRIPLDDKAFRHFDGETGRFEREGGTWEVRVGASCADLRLTARVEVPGTVSPAAGAAGTLPHYCSGDIQAVPDEEFQRLLGRPIPPARWDRSAPLGRNDTVSQLFYAKQPLARLVWRFLDGRQRRFVDRGRPDLNILFIWNIPFRGIAKMMGGAVDLPMVDALLEMVNGHLFRGLGRFLGAYRQKKRAARGQARALAQAGEEVPHG